MNANLSNSGSIPQTMGATEGCRRGKGVVRLAFLERSPSSCEGLALGLTQTPHTGVKWGSVQPHVLGHTLTTGRSKRKVPAHSRAGCGPALTWKPPSPKSPSAFAVPPLHPLGTRSLSQSRSFSAFRLGLFGLSCCFLSLRDPMSQIHGSDPAHGSPSLHPKSVN